MTFDGTQRQVEADAAEFTRAAAAAAGQVGNFDTDRLKRLAEAAAKLSAALAKAHEAQQAVDRLLSN